MKRLLHKNLVRAAIAAIGLAAAAITAARADDRKPLLMEGKQTLYKRVLTRPGADLRKTPAMDAETVATLAPFEPFFVYAENKERGAGWLEVGRSRSAGPEGWLASEKAIPWAQTIVAAFSNPAGRERTLVFRDKPSMQEAFNSEDVVARLGQLRANAAGGLANPDGPVISIEPENHVDIDSNFYILPILEFERARIQNNQRAKFLKIASLSAREDDAPTAAAPADLLADYKVGIVFVIDTTLSMQDYIEQTREAVEDIRQRIGESEQGKRVRFGLIGFRDSIAEKPELEYATKTFLKLDVDSTAGDFVRSIKGMKAATVSTQGFNEDAIAGVASAIKEMNWEPFGGRYIVVVSDAGPQPPGEDSAFGDLAVPELNQLAREKNIAIVALHLKTEQGSFDHEDAEAAYRVMAATPQGRTLYFNIDAANPANFRDTVGQLASSLSSQIAETIRGRLTEPTADGGSDIENETRLVGRAMQLAYLGRVAGTTAPDILEGWVSDRDPIDRKARPVDARVLMSKNELATLRDVIRETIDVGNSTLGGDSREFFRRLQEAMARMARDPQRLVNTSFDTLGDALGEYLSDLPYESEITGLSAEDWGQLSPSRERLLVDSLESKIVALDAIHNDSARWVAPYDAAPDGEYVTAVPLSVMP